MVISSAILSSLFVLLNATGVYADVVDTVTVPVSCSMTSIVGTEHTTSINVGTYEDEIGETTFKGGELGTPGNGQTIRCVLDE